MKSMAQVSELFDRSLRSWWRFYLLQRIRETGDSLIFREYLYRHYPTLVGSDPKFTSRRILQSLPNEFPKLKSKLSSLDRSKLLIYFKINGTINYHTTLRLWLFSDFDLLVSSGRALTLLSGRKDILRLRYDT